MTKQDLHRFNALWTKRLQLFRWRIVHKIGRVEREDSTAQTLGRPEYRQGMVVWAEGELSEMDERHFIHEMLHLVLSPLSQTAKRLAATEFERETVREANEAVTTHLTDILTAAYNPCPKA